MKRGFLGALALLLALVLANPLLAADTRDFFKVGVVTSISGELATGGNVTKRGYDLWAAAVNAQGGIAIGGKKYPVKLFYADAQSQPSQGAAAAERLITQEHVDFILGPYSSGVTMAVAPVVEKYKVPTITGSAESPLIWTNKFLYTFGTIPPVSFTGAVPIKTLTEMKHPADRRYPRFQRHLFQGDRRVFPGCRQGGRDPGAQVQHRSLQPGSHPPDVGGARPAARRGGLRRP